MGVVCFLGDGHSAESEYGAEEEGGDWGGVCTRPREEEKDIVHWTSGHLCCHFHISFI